MGNTRRRQTTIRLGGLLALILFTLTACFGNLGGAQSPSLEEIQPYEPEPTALNAFNESAASEDAPAASAMVSSAFIFANLPLLYLEIALENWDESYDQTYTDQSGTYTTTWDRDGDVWTWTLTFDDGSTMTTVDITVTAVDDGWDVVIAINDETLVTGLYTDSSTSGLVTFFSGGGSDEKWVVEWGESETASYDLNYTVAYYGSDGLVDRELILDYTSNGSAGAWQYTDNSDPVENAGGSWVL